MTEPSKEFSLVEKEIPQAGDGMVIIKVAGCGVCHTDLSFWKFGVKTRHQLPLTLGHEISGTVISDGELSGKNVIVPAVIPCGKCDLCNSGRSNICRSQLMPGNDFDGGFATHIVVPSRFLCHVPDSVLKKYPLEKLSVIADAVSTPYQVMKKSELAKGDLAIVIGVGGVGIYGALIAKVVGAKVIALDISDEKLNLARKNGIDAAINIKDLDQKAIKEKIKEAASQIKCAGTGWKIFEISGTKSGQELAFSLITYASTLSIVGFTMEKLELRLSNLMAFDAKLIGTWGCRAELYPEVLALVDSGALDISDFIECFPLDMINEVFKNTLEHKYKKRSVLVPQHL